MDPSWQNYHDPSSAAGASRRHNGSGQMAPQQQPPPQQQHHQQPQQSPLPSQQQHQHHQHPSAPATAAYPYDQYPPAAVAANQPGQGPVGGVSSPIGSQHLAHRDGNGDIAMRDAHDPHAGIKYAMRPHHQPHLSGGGSSSAGPGSGRASAIHSPLDALQPSSAAQRYSPMETSTLSPTSPYAPKTASQFAHPPSQSHSPSGGAPGPGGDYPQSPYFAGRQPPQLPPISPYAATHDGYPSSAVANLDGAFANAAKASPRRVVPQIKPVPEFKKVRAMSDLQPKNSRQPPFRRANPEGGFISVC